MNEAYRLLLVEWDAVLAEVMKLRLELLGYEVDVAADCGAALEWTGDYYYDLFLINVDNLDAAGISLIAEFRRLKRTGSVPVVALSIETSLELIERARRAGAEDFVAIPFDPLALEAKVAGFIRQRSVSTAHAVLPEAT